MATSPYLANLVINWALRAQSPTAPTTLYLALFSGDPASSLTNELVFDDYARRALVLDAPIGGTTRNTVDISFGTIASDWGDVTHFGVFDALTSGNLLFSEGFNAPFTASAADTVQILAGVLELAWE